MLGYGGLCKRRLAMYFALSFNCHGENRAIFECIQYDYVRNVRFAIHKPAAASAQPVCRIQSLFQLYPIYIHGQFEDDSLETKLSSII